MASVHRDGTRKTWMIRWREAGKNRALRGIASKALAEHQARRIEHDLSTRAPIAPGALLTLPDACTRYLAAHPTATPSYQASVERSWRIVCGQRNWTTWGQITPETVADLGQYHARIVRAILHWAQDNGQPIHPRVLAAAKPKIRRQPQAPLPEPATIAAAIATADAIHPADGTLLHLVATYGHRAQSLVQLRAKAWEPRENTLTLHVKSGDLHRHPVLPETATRLNALANGLPPDAFLFIGHLQKPWQSGAAFSGWLVHTINKDLGILDLRRHAISHMLALGLDARTVASITGHRTVSLLLNTYARTTDARQSAAITAMVGSQNVLTPHHNPLSGP